MFCVRLCVRLIRLRIVFGRLKVGKSMRLWMICFML